MQQASRTRSFLELLAIAILTYIVVHFGLGAIFPQYFGPADKKISAPVTLDIQGSRSLAEGATPILTLSNNTEKDMQLTDRCPQPPVNIAILRKKTGGEEEKLDLIANETDAPCEPLTVLPANEKVLLNLGPWKYSLLSELGEYEASFDLPQAGSATGAVMSSTRFTLSEPGMITKAFRGFVTKPLFNLLILIASHVPGHSLGIAIIILTIIVKIFLLVPSQRALVAQKKLQELQPKMNEIKKQYEHDPKKLQEETMKLWKDMNINPLQSCLPTLLQMPVLIGLFFVVQDAVHVEAARHLFYNLSGELPLQSFDHIFLGLDLAVPNRTILPILLVAMQFLQMKLMMQKKKEKVIVLGKEPKKMDQQTIMMYVMPLLIGVFAFQFPAGVALYWGASTIFAIVQQLIVNRKTVSV